ncbi:surfeit locus protein 6 homolog [Hydractinia symbiolongicarpus]|uniref:surfeit locus protein 6 homolog n=1 Tax=Hydractinia symbiolongicarpus TaxID=13093 RepID=UPI00254D6EBE|nr:surfeit locus protein 6 homolog [Hydractinia symbiolongicarpus]
MAADNVAEVEKLKNIVKETTCYFSSVVELIPAKFYVQNEFEDGNVKPGRKKKLKPENKKLLAKKAKFLKLDPSNHKTISELQKEVERKETEYFAEEIVEIAEQVQPVKVSSIPSASLDELREKLHAKMHHLRGKRKILAEDDKLKVKNARMAKKDIDTKKKKQRNETENIKRVSELEEKSINGDIKNIKGEVVFSKFDFAVGISDNKKKKKADIKKLLQIAEKKQEKIKNLQQEDSGKANALKKKIAWDNAVKKAEGQKLKDDPKLLKKSIKRKEKLKEKSKKRWDDRTATVANEKEEKQKLRKQHLRERRDEKLNKKKGVKKVKKKSRPGF